MLGGSGGVQAWPPLAAWLSANLSNCLSVKASEEMTEKLARQLNRFGRSVSSDLANDDAVRVGFCLACSNDAAFLQQAKCAAIATVHMFNEFGD